MYLILGFCCVKLPTIVSLIWTTLLEENWILYWGLKTVSFKHKPTLCKISTLSGFFFSIFSLLTSEELKVIEKEK